MIAKTERLRPNTFVIGAPKCGTTALARYLSEHPDAAFSTPKEPLFWCDDIEPEPHALRARDLDEYLSFFPPRDGGAAPKVTAEGTTAYLRSETAVRNIEAFTGGTAKYLIMLRRPLEIVSAFHMEQRYVMQEPRERLVDAWREQEERERRFDAGGADRPPEAILYRRVASIGRQVERVLETADPARVRVIFMDDFAADAGKVYRETLAFLELEDDGREDFPVVNSAHRQASAGLARLLLHPPKPVKGLIEGARMHFVRNPNKLVSFIKSRLNRPAKREVIDAGLRVEIERFFADDVRRLSRVCERDLSDWIGCGG